MLNPLILPYLIRSLCLHFTETILGLVLLRRKQKTVARSQELKECMDASCTSTTQSEILKFLSDMECGIIQAVLKKLFVKFKSYPLQKMFKHGLGSLPSKIGISEQFEASFIFLTCVVLKMQYVGSLHTFSACCMAKPFLSTFLERIHYKQQKASRLPCCWLSIA